MMNKKVTSEQVAKPMTYSQDGRDAMPLKDTIKSNDVPVPNKKQELK